MRSSAMSSSSRTGLVAAASGRVVPSARLAPLGPWRDRGAPPGGPRAPPAFLFPPAARAFFAFLLLDTARTTSARAPPSPGTAAGARREDEDVAAPEGPAPGSPGASRDANGHARDAAYRIVGSARRRAPNDVAIARRTTARPTGAPARERVG